MDPGFRRECDLGWQHYALIASRTGAKTEV